MSPGERRDVLVVLYKSDGPSPLKDEQRIRLPAGAGFSDLLRELERESPSMYAEVRRRILRSAGRVLAYGKDDDLLPALTRQLADGGPIIFPVEDEARSATIQVVEPFDVA
jgi:hypothetical protein